ncbi:ATP-binding protein [Scytonema sp. NUACC26]|uniref:hybrid sensor histidine kinase/response regulator n=1 Tax=Scytonema sp. NUACC26 TaxID=3140176 RepID=UPI0034DBDE39
MEDSRDKIEIQNELRTEVRDTLLNPTLWHPVLEEYALAMNLAVVLTDSQGQMLGECINPQPIWNFFQTQMKERPGCPFCLLRSVPCTAIADALHQGEIVFTSDRLGLAHFVVPLQLGEHRLGTLIAGQVFDQFPDRLQLQLEQNAKRLNLSPQQVWKLASQQRPVAQKTLRMYAKLLRTLGKTFIETRYHTLMESERSALLSRLYDQLRRSEQQYRLLAEALPQFVWNSLPDGQVIYCNQYWYHYTGLTPEQTLNLGWAVVLHPDDRERTQALWQKALRTGESYEIEYRFRRAEDGQYRWHLGSIGPVRDSTGQIINWVGTAIDIEDRKQAEDTLQQQTKQSIEANRVKDEFLAVLSHELRSPLNPILGWSKLLQSRKLDEQTTIRALEIIERNAKLQTQLIDDLLDVSRILQGKLSFDVCPVDLAITIQSAMETVRLAALAKEIQMQVEFEPEVGQVLGDSSRLQQVIWNLLSNAIKFTPEGGRVDIYLHRIETHAHIVVSDTGKGIHPDFLPHVFEYFRQGDSTITRQFGGLGLGLAIVHRLVELHGGTVQAESPGEGQGATFTVKLPLTQQQHTTQQNLVQSQQPSDLNTLKILVVDDDIDTREYITFLLQEYGATVTAVVSAVEALIALSQYQFDLLISDIGMPEVDGYMLLQQVRSSSVQNRQVPAIALTAYAGEINYQRAMAAGFQQHLAKPVEPEQLVRAIVQILHQSMLYSSFPNNPN